jgi:hypothetical protein
MNKWVELPHVNGAITIRPEEIVGHRSEDYNGQRFVILKSGLELVTHDSKEEFLRRLDAASRCDKDCYTLSDHARKPTAQRNLEELAYTLARHGPDSPSVQVFMMEHQADRDFMRCGQLLIEAFKTLCSIPRNS